jgi:hypothetical protein
MMKMPRMTSAITMPIESTFCRYCLGTANDDMMITNTNRLSTDNEYSVIQPAKNSPPYLPPRVVQMTNPNTTASATYTPIHTVHSLSDGLRGLREIR